MKREMTITCAGTEVITHADPESPEDMRLVRTLAQVTAMHYGKVVTDADFADDTNECVMSGDFVCNGLRIETNWDEE